MQGGLRTVENGHTLGTGQLLFGKNLPVTGPLHITGSYHGGNRAFGVVSHRVLIRKRGQGGSVRGVQIQIPCQHGKCLLACDGGVGGHGSGGGAAHESSSQRLCQLVVIPVGFRHIGVVGDCGTFLCQTGEPVQDRGKLGPGHSGVGGVVPFAVACQIPVVHETLERFFSPMSLDVAFKCESTGYGGEKHHQRQENAKGSSCNLLHCFLPS